MNNKSRSFLLSITLLLLTACNPPTQKTSLMQAAEQGQLTTVEQLIAQNHGINERNQQGLNALLYAIIFDHFPIVEYLLMHGADANTADKFGNSALILAAATGNSAIISTLLQAHAEINAANQKGITPLMAAAGAGQFKAAILLLSSGANACLKNQAQQTALQIAEQWWGVDEIKKAILKHPQLKPLLCEAHA